MQGRDREATLPWAGLLCARPRLLGHNQPEPTVAFCLHCVFHTQVCPPADTSHRAHPPVTCTTKHTAGTTHASPSITEPPRQLPPSHLHPCCSSLNTHTLVHTHTTHPRASTSESHIWTCLSPLAPAHLPFSCPQPQPDTPCMPVRRPQLTKREEVLVRDDGERGRMGRTQQSDLFIPGPGPAHGRGWGRTGPSPPIVG